MSSCDAKKKYLLVTQEEMFTFLVTHCQEEISSRDEKEMSSCDTRRSVYLSHKRKCPLASQDISPPVTKTLYSNIIFLLYLMSCILNAPTILGVSEGMCSINLGGLQADLNGWSGGGGAPPVELNSYFCLASSIGAKVWCHRCNFCAVPGSWVGHNIYYMP